MQAKEWDTLCTSIPAGGVKGYTLHIHTAGGGKEYTLHVHTAGNGWGYTLYCTADLMMALMVLGMPQVYSCNIATGCGAPLGAGIPEPKTCPPVGSGEKIVISGTREEFDTKQWRRLPSIHCMAMQ